MTDGEIAEAKSQVSNLSYTVNGLESAVAEVNTKVDGHDDRIIEAETTISQHSDEIQTTASKVDIIEGDYTTSTKLNSAITQSANSIKQEVSQTYTTKTETGTAVSTLRSEIEASAGRIEFIAEGAKTTANEASTKATEANTKASTVVDDDNKVKASIIVSAINDSEVKIDAEKIDLTGYVTVSDLAGEGTTTIDGSNIKTGKISADHIDVTGLTADSIVVKDASDNILFSACSIDKAVNIAGFQVKENAIYNGATDVGPTGIALGGVYTGTDGILVSSGKLDGGICNYVFLESATGKIYANNAELVSATVQGKITSDSGKIGGFEITGDRFYKEASDVSCYNGVGLYNGDH